MRQEINQQQTMRIRMTTSRDRGEIRDIHLCAFSEDEREIVSNLAINLLSEETIPRTFSLIVKIGDTAVGHISFSPVTLESDDLFQGYILAPLAVKPRYQKRRIGSGLIETGLQQLSKMKVDVLFVYGDPQYYGKFGFSTDVAGRYTPPYELQYPFGWQAIALDGYCVSDSSGALSCVTSLCDPKLW
uniref:Putative acetyltransferase n=1 Tax=Candidatus Kentrum sp. LPFa TaxID=2126335 RepID=A0A450VXE9_9GAMM|nr:MAG: putative acetyltransferase [Candidatus Kentron sp. LPFa]